MAAGTNFITEAEAAGKWCHAAAPTATYNGSAVQGQTGQDIGTPVTGRVCCVASECMAWRWADMTLGYCGIPGFFAPPPWKK